MDIACARRHDERWDVGPAEDPVGGAAHKKSRQTAFALRTDDDRVDVAIDRIRDDRFCSPTVENDSGSDESRIARPFYRFRKYGLGSAVEHLAVRGRRTPGRSGGAIDGVRKQHVALVAPGHGDRKRHRAITIRGAIRGYE
ncbi:MAG: hypothetical protein NVSMB19_20770 [Vulcanimicrobiaceae bacterium]